MTDDSSFAESVQCEEDSQSAVTGQRWLSIAQTPLLLTVLSALAFLVAGTWAWSLELVLLLFPVLLMHEVGHLLTMRAFGYQGIRFFFVPLLGAAVAGRSPKASAAQKIVVCLAGPVPGILIAVLLWWSGIAANDGLSRAFTVMLLLVNGINLLPILPLDGGWLFQTLLLTRRPWTDFGFRCCTPLILLSAAAFAKSWLLAVVALLFTTGLKAAFHFCRVQSRLLHTLADNSHPHHIELSNETILQEVRGEFPGAILTERAAKEWIQRMRATLDPSAPKQFTAIALCCFVALLLLASGGILFDLLQTPEAETTLAMHQLLTT